MNTVKPYFNTCIYMQHTNNELVLYNTVVYLYSTVFNVYWWCSYKLLLWSNHDWNLVCKQIKKDHIVLHSCHSNNWRFCSLKVYEAELKRQCRSKPLTHTKRIPLNYTIRYVCDSVCVCRDSAFGLYFMIFLLFCCVWDYISTFNDVFMNNNC